MPPFSLSNFFACVQWKLRWGSLLHLGWATWWVTVQRWSFKWGGREARRGWLLTYRPSVSLISEQHKTENIKDTHKGRGIPGFYSLHLRVLETHTGHSGPVRVGGGAPGVKTWLENSFCVRERRKVLCVIRPPSLSDIFSRAGPSESPQNAGHFFDPCWVKGEGMQAWSQGHHT